MARSGKEMRDHLQSTVVEAKQKAREVERLRTSGASHNDLSEAVKAAEGALDGVRGAQVEGR